MVAIKNLESLQNLLPKIFMVKSKRDGRLGTIIKISGDGCTIKMENVERTISLDLNTLSEGFVFIFSKKEAVCDWYHIKYQRQLVPRLLNPIDVYISMQIMYDDLTQLYPEITNHQIFVILNNLKIFFNKNGKY